MALTLTEAAGGKTLVVQANGKLTKADYEQFGPEAEDQIKRHGKIRVLFDLHDFHGWDAGALWEDVKFDVKHFNHIERLAVVGEKKWEKWMATFCKPFTTAEVRYFDRAHADQAHPWLEGG